ncbi:ATP/GTP-binding protein [Streptomyces sp. NPDC059916]|uniref:ATP/GTP-binding protein n=1 Tax=Streptomyces sp. NPDC059916 TaxID=3347001 RepID=UPI003699B278
MTVAVAASAATFSLMISGAQAADGPSANPRCDNSGLLVTVCARDRSGTPGGTSNSGRDAKAAGGTSRGKASAPTCTYERADPQPPQENLAMKEGKRQGGKGAVYLVECPATGRSGTIWIPAGLPAAPQVDPEVLARRAADSMKLVGPEIASPRAAGRYVVGMPTWMWVDESPTTFGPNTATATAGGVSVTATAKVSSIRWNMGDGTEPETCDGPGTEYQASMGKAKSPDCGHVYEQASTTNEGGKFHGTATATWTIDWKVTGAPANAGQFTEVRATRFSVAVHEVQVVN